MHLIFTYFIRYNVFKARLIYEQRHDSFTASPRFPATSCFASFQLKITDKRVDLVSTSYGVPAKTNNDTTHQCYQFTSTNHSIQCSAYESCNKTCPLMEPFTFAAFDSLKVLCCCDNRKNNMCNMKTEFGQKVLIEKEKTYTLRSCVHRHILQHIFHSDIYGSNCIVYYDFSLMKPLNLIYGYNMEFEELPEEIYGSEENLIVADIFEYRNLEKSWLNCCAEVNVSKEQIDHITNKVKAWTVGILKCDSATEPSCDANLVQRIHQDQDYYLNYYREKYGRLCYVKDYNEQKVTLSRSLETTWCYEETFGRGLDFINRRDFMTQDKTLPAGKTCSHKLKTEVRYSNNTMFAHCFVMKRDNGEAYTVCCCSSTINEPCNFISEKYHIEKTNVHYSKKTLQAREHCLLLDGRRDLCFLGDGQKVVCYYIADMKNGTVEGGCALSLTRKVQPHKLANICLIKALYNLALPVEYLHAGEAVKIFCCAGRDDCKQSVQEMRRFKRFFETEQFKPVKTLKEEDFAFISSR